jgi:hypothetical protein
LKETYSEDDATIDHQLANHIWFKWWQHSHNQGANDRNNSYWPSP